MRLQTYIDGEKKVMALHEGTLVIGRAKDCDLVIPAKGISRRHAQITVKSGQATVRDLGSSNGIYVNEKKVKELSLTDGDVIGLGKFTMTFEGANDLTEDMVDATPVLDDNEDFEFIEDRP